MATVTFEGATRLYPGSATPARPEPAPPWRVRARGAGYPEWESAAPTAAACQTIAGARTRAISSIQSVPPMRQ